MIIYDYSEPKNNCFIVKHSNKLLNEFVEQFIIDTENNQITINYFDFNSLPKITNGKKLSIQVEKEIILDVLNRFGLIQDEIKYQLLDVVEKTDLSITYKYKSNEN